MIRKGQKLMRITPELYPVRDYLREISQADQIIRSTTRELKHLEECKSTLQGIAYDGVRVQHSSTPPVEASVIRLEECRRRLMDIIMYSTKRREKILETISHLENSAHIRLLWSYYCDGDTWSEIAEDMGYSERHMARMHVEALLAFGRAAGMLTSEDVDRVSYDIAG